MRPIRPIYKGPLMCQLGGSVPDELNEPKGLGDASRSKRKGKVDPVNKKAEKKRIAAKAKASKREGFQPSGSATIPPCSAVQKAVNIPQPPLPRAPSLTPLLRSASELSSESSLSKRRRTCQWTFSHVDLVMPFSNAAPHHKATLISLIGGVGVSLPNPDRLSISELIFFDWASDVISVIGTGNRVIGAYEAEVQKREDRIKTLASRSDVDTAWQETSALKKEKQRLEEEVKKRDVHLETASAEIAELRASLEKSHLTVDLQRKERDGARHRANEIASGSSARSARHSCSARISLEYELPPGLLENYAKEEEEYLAKVESFDADSLGDDIMFSTPPPPPTGPPRDVASRVPEGINEHGSFLSPPR
ncbi:hypothetical protein AALP_AA7G109800 [Arabis alpina]|uniref:Uncharacterized protein n=1 Tax=Arabis alpina TaxID=50452 RepID=A0A087GHA7_ARAAL|nr:hypothetical protein AALP_AA7G109800 [Arabis alpina]